MRNNTFPTSICLCLLFLFGCMRSTEICYPEPQGKIIIEGDKLYLNNELYAELRYPGSYYSELRNNKLHKENPVGLAIYYYPNDREEWIFPKQGLGYYIVEEKKKYSTVFEMDELDRTAKERGLTYRSFVTGEDFIDTEKVFPMIGDKIYQPTEKSPASIGYDIHFTEDGRYVCYQSSGRSKRQSYRVKYGEDFSK
ncbi:MAG: hypothetical protein K1000chlam4_00156 [Chlamydiae bacterium]|nr:hypothetical protein [Chlamydiota bacterium]